jgi:hypothetical protein
MLLYQLVLIEQATHRSFMKYETAPNLPFCFWNAFLRGVLVFGIE